jgi:DNA repair exonuclease SbcCD ATPase subunit
MSEIGSLVNRQVLLAELQQAFDEQTAGVLLSVLDKVVTQIYQVGIPREDFRELKQTVGELAEAQQRTQQQVTELAEAQQRTEQRVAELAEAQQRTQQQVAELVEAQQRTEQRVAELAEAQQRTEQRVAELAEAQRRSEERLGRLESAIEQLVHAIDGLRKQVGGLSDMMGGDIEDVAHGVVYATLRRELGWQVSMLERVWKTWDDEPEEIDIFGTAIDSTKPERKIWIVGEAKRNLTLREVEKFSEQLRRARENLPGEIFPVCFCYRARPEVQEAAQNAGIRLIFFSGKLI